MTPARFDWPFIAVLVCVAVVMAFIYVPGVA